MRVVVLLVVVVVVAIVTTGKQSQLPGLAWDGSLTKARYKNKLYPSRMKCIFCGNYVIKLRKKNLS